MGIAHPSFPHEINKVWEIVEPAPSAVTRLLWSLGMIPMPVSDHWSFILDVLFCGITLAGLRIHRATNMPFWKIDKLVRKLVGANPFRAHDAIGSKGADFLTWSCLHHLSEEYGALFTPDAGADRAQGDRPGLVSARSLSPAGRLDARRRRAGALPRPPARSTVPDDEPDAARATRAPGGDERDRRALRAVPPRRARDDAHARPAGRDRHGRGQPSPLPRGRQERLASRGDREHGRRRVAAALRQRRARRQGRRRHAGTRELQLGRRSRAEPRARLARWEGIRRVIVTGDFHLSTQMVGADTAEFFAALDSLDAGLAITNGWSRPRAG